MKIIALTIALALAASACATQQRPVYAPTETTSGVVCQEGYELDKDGKCVPTPQPNFDIP